MRNAHSLASEGFIVSMLLAPNLSSFNNRMSCSVVSVCFSSHLPSVRSVWRRVGKASFSCLCCRYRPQYPVLSAVPVHEVRAFPFSFGVGSVGVNLQAYTYFVFPNASTYLYKYFRLFVGSPVCRIRPLLSVFFFHGVCSFPCWKEP